MPTYPTYKLGEIIDKVPIEFKVKQKEYLSNGKFPVVDQGQDLIGGFVDDESLLVKTELPVIVFGDHTKAKKFIDFPFVAGADGTKIIKPKKDFFIEPKLFYWFLHCVKFPDKGYARHFQYLLKSDIAVPPLPTQQAIVTRIESLFAELDKAAVHLRTAQQQLKTYRQAVLNHWLNNEDGKWEMVKLGEVAEIKGGKRLPKGHYYSEKPTEYRYIMAGNLKNNTVSLDTNFIEKATYEVLKHYEVIGGEVYITIVGACIGDVGIIPANLGCSILTENAAKIVNINNLTPDFLTIVLRSSCAKTQIKSKILSATLGKLALSRIAEIVVPLPPLTEQHRIVQEIESRLSQAEAAEASIAEALQKTEALRQSILKKAFSGELV